MSQGSLLASVGRSPPRLTSRTPPPSRLPAHGGRRSSGGAYLNTSGGFRTRFGNVWLDRKPRPFACREDLRRNRARLRLEDVPKDRLAQEAERLLDVLAGLRARVHVPRVERLRELVHLLLVELGLVHEVRLVHRDHRGDPPAHPHHAVDPVVKLA